MREWFVMIRTYKSYGGHSTLSLLSEFFLKNMPDFGPALQELSITFHFAHPGPARPTLEDLFKAYHADLAKLPKIVYRRSRESASLDFESNIISGPDLDRYGLERMDWFTRGAFEVVENLEHLAPRFKRTDEFDINGFMAHCRGRLDTLPMTESDFQEVLSSLKIEDQLRREKLSPWEKLGIDFRDFHPEARSILDDPFYWDLADDFAPNGNDTGADVLGEYRNWLKRHSPDDALEFLQQLIDRWNIKNEHLACAEATIGLAFADIKLRGECHRALRSRALEALIKLSQLAEEQTNEAVREDWTRSIRKMEGKLREIGSS